MQSCKMSSEENKPIVPYEQPSGVGTKRKRGRPRKYEYIIYPTPRRAQPVQDAPSAQGAQDNPNAAQTTVEANSSIPQDGIQANQSLGDGHYPNVPMIQALPAGLSACSSRSRGSAKRVKSSANQAAGSSPAPGQGHAPRGTTGNSGRDDILGKPFVGHVDEKFGSWYLISVRVENHSPIFGWIQDPDHTVPITLENDLAPEIPMFRRRQVPNPGSTAGSQAVPPMPVHPANVTVAQPLQMRKPNARRFTRAAPRPPLGPKPAAPVSRGTTSGNAASSAAGMRLAEEPEVQAKTLESLAKQEFKPVDPQPSSAAVQLKSVQPVSGSVPLANHEAQKVTEALLGDKALNGTKDSSVQIQQLNTPVMDRVKESSGQIQQLNTTIMDGVKEPSGPQEKPNTANNEHQIITEPSVTEQTKTKISEVPTGGEGSKAGVGTSGVTPELVSETSVLDGVNEAPDQKERINAKTSEPAQTEALSGENLQTDFQLARDETIMEVDGK